MSVAQRHAEGSSRIAFLFVLVALIVMGTAIGVAWLLMHELGRHVVNNDLVFPRVFLFSTMLLGCGSYTLSKAVRAVRRERQQKFRLWILLSLACAALFVGTQIYGLWSMFPPQNVRKPESAALGVTGFIVTFTTLHAVHFCVATLFVCFIAARTTTHRYDHEYYWGVTVCAWFWHALGVAWIAIMCIFAIVL